MLDTSNGSCLATERTTVGKKSVVLKPRSNETSQSYPKSRLSQIETQDSDLVPEPEWRGEVEVTLFKHLEYLVSPSDIAGKRNLKAAIQLALDEIEGA